MPTQRPTEEKATQPKATTPAPVVAPHSPDLTDEQIAALQTGPSVPTPITLSTVVAPNGTITQVVE